MVVDRSSLVGVKWGLGEHRAGTPAGEGRRLARGGSWVPVGKQRRQQEEAGVVTGGCWLEGTVTYTRVRGKGKCDILAG